METALIFSQVFSERPESMVAPPPYWLGLLNKMEKGPGGYVLLSRTTPGPYERRDLFFEQPYRAGPDRAP